MVERNFEYNPNPQEDESDNSDITRRDFLKMSAAGLLGARGLAMEIEQQRNPEISTKRAFLVEVRPSHNMPDGFSRFELHREDGSGRSELVGSFFAMETGSTSHIEFISNKLHPQFFTPELNFDAVRQSFGNGKQVVLESAGAFTPDYKQIQGLAYEQGQSVGQSTPSEHQGLLVIKNSKPEIAYLNEVNLPNFLEQAKQNKWSFFQQIPAIKHGTINFRSNNQALLETRFFVERKTPTGTTSGVINFSKRMTIPAAIEVMAKMDNSQSKIENALYLDTGAVSEGYFYTKDGKANRMVDEQFFANAQAERENKKKYTNLIVLWSGK